MSGAKFKMTCLHNGADPLGGNVTSENAALTMLSAWVSGPDLGALQVGEHQIREATTNDGYYYPDTRGKPGQRASTRKRIRYRVERVQ